MQFIPGGPEIPDALLQAHEDGRVVFFCGAGISYPAGLPGFSGLVKQIYKRIGTDFTHIEQQAFDSEKFDSTLDLLERRLPGQRLQVRRALSQVLKPNLRRKNSTDAHSALLRLATCRDGSLRLVTTNFDRVFHIAAKRSKLPYRTYSAPMLPVPKNSRWDGLVYLHGHLPERYDDSDLNRLVVTSGDFGLAYLTERWAARFVSELFRNYVVCFVGYSINDPVLRYMMDALAADQMLGEVKPLSWALCDYEKGNEEQKTIEWEAKGVQPVLYETFSSGRDHSMLHSTLKAWAETYRDGVQGKESIVVKSALAQPQSSTQQDNFVGRMLWALSDSSGLPAKTFAEFTPAPSLDWLFDVFSQPQFGHNDLRRFCVFPNQVKDDKLRFSLIHRPAPYQLSPSMHLASGSNEISQWDEVQYHLAKWVTRHLNNPRLIVWIAQRGGVVHDRMKGLIEHALDTYDSLGREGKENELAEIRRRSPNAIPNDVMKRIWRLVLNGRIKSTSRHIELYRWKRRLKRDGFTTSLRLSLRELLEPKVAIRQALQWDEKYDSDAEPIRLRQLIDWELTLSSDHSRSSLSGLQEDYWISALPNLLNEFQLLLLDALSLKEELGEASHLNDRSYYDLPSISPHYQNRRFREWVGLIELVRDSWLELRSHDSRKASAIATAWFELPYPTFKRLAFFAASHDDTIPPETWVGWLLAEDNWLWSIETSREMHRLLFLQGTNLTGDSQLQLETAILAGPLPNESFDVHELAQTDEDSLRPVWHRLSKLKASGLILSSKAEDRLREISTTFPTWVLPADERDEFSFWMSGTGDPGFEDNRVVNIVPNTRQEIVEWLRSDKNRHQDFEDDTWRDVCRTRFYHSMLALCDLANEDVWPVNRWNQALMSWAHEDCVARSWRYAARLVQRMPDSLIKEIAHGVAWWLEAASKAVNCHEEVLLELCERVLELTGEEDDDKHSNVGYADQYLMQAINHPVGMVTQAIINLWFMNNPNDNDLLPSEIRRVFTNISDAQEYRYRHGRVLLGSRLIPLFRVDHVWTEQHLLPLFNWSNLDEAKYVWHGFLWSPRLYQPLLISFKQEFLESARHYSELGEMRHQFAAFITYVALEQTQGFDTSDFRSAFNSLPQEGLEEAALALTQALDGSGEKREEYWINRISPFLQEIWPKNLSLRTPRLAESMARLAVSARSEFPAALASVKDWLQRVEDPGYVVQHLHDSGLCNRFPHEAVSLLSTVVSDHEWVPTELVSCLNDIVQADPELESDARYKSLRVYQRRRNS